ncbi:unnamed protein product [Prorocentrum cordatum]|uniref:Uncharacterized protein n=1 Tax=Prorocentrum cordatum TaxID=2364126 RepID=A0ABN9T1V6_9DINO|nr:unnamed protein product [Polarella glacialis]
MFQADGWTCGFWVARWVGRALREIRGEGRKPPIGVTRACARGNEWIQKLQDASDNHFATAKAKAKARSKGKAKPPSDPTAPEPKYGSLEEALVAALTCAKCLPCKDGSTGCRACMGEWFEHMRKRSFLARAVKRWRQRPTGHPASAAWPPAREEACRVQPFEAAGARCEGQAQPTGLAERRARKTRRGARLSRLEGRREAAYERRGVVRSQAHIRSHPQGI